MQAIDVVLLFLERGGSVLWLLFVTSILFWTLFFEKVLYLFHFRRRVKILQKRCRKLPHKEHWTTRQKCVALLSEIKSRLFKNIATLRGIIALFPLIGLLGTITGMLSVFDSINLFGANAKAMASGISMATLPTMAGMLLALLALLFFTPLLSLLKTVMERLTATILRGEDA